MKNSNLTPTQAQLISNITAQFSTLNAKQSTTKKFSIVNMAHYDNIAFESADFEGSIHIHNEALWDAEHIEAVQIVELLNNDFVGSGIVASFDKAFNRITIVNNNYNKMPQQIYIVDVKTDEVAPNGKAFKKVESFMYKLCKSSGSSNGYNSIHFDTYDKLFESTYFDDTMKYLIQ